jgi:hypothetical protein
MWEIMWDVLRAYGDDGAECRVFVLGSLVCLFIREVQLGVGSGIEISSIYQVMDFKIP